jgi:RimJ/RimL family protein N-acetyltransferase
VLVRLRQEVQALSRRVIAPPGPLSGESIRLEPISEGAAADFERFVSDPEIRRYTRAPSNPPVGFGATWAARYAAGWRDGNRAGFLIRAADGVVVGFVAFVELDHEGRQAEAGYAVDAAARGRGIASEALRVLAAWGFDELGLERIELLISAENQASKRVAERCGFTYEGTLRSLHVKEGLRADTTVWSRLSGD